MSTSSKGSLKGILATATAVAVAITTFGSTPVLSAPASAAPKQAQMQTAPDGFVEVAAKRRHRHYRGGNAAAVAAFAGIVGTIATLAARDRYERRYYYDPYYGHSPYAYGAPYGYDGGYYAPRYRYDRGW
jgi:hypothetical protein